MTHRVSFLPGRHQAVVEVRIGLDLKASLLVDTGADRTILVPSMMHRLGLKQSDQLGSRRVCGVGGQQVAPTFLLDRMMVGALVLVKHEVTIVDLPNMLRVDGLLGLDVLRRFRVTFEFDTRTLVLRALPA